MRRLLSALTAGACAAAVSAAATPASAAPATTRVSERNGMRANGFSVFPAVSATGRYVTFQSLGTNLVPGDTNNARDVFRVDRTNRRVVLVSATPAGRPGNADSGRLGPSPVTPDGRYVAFDSTATDLVANDRNGAVRDAFLRDLKTRRTTLLSAGGNGDSFPLAVTPDGRYGVFLSAASNLVPGDTNGAADVFLRDRRTGTTTRVSLGTGNLQADGPSRAASISADGRYVAFESTATNLAPGDTNGRADVFVRDRRTGTTTLISQGCESGGLLAGCHGTSISADGRYVVYESTPPDSRTQAWRFDRSNGQTQLVSVSPDGVFGNGFNFRPAISPNGRYVSFDSDATNLVEDTGTARTIHVYVRDMRTGRTVRASVSGAGAPGDAESRAAAPSDRGVAFESRAGNLAPGAVQGDIQVYFRTF